MKLLFTIPLVTLGLYATQPAEAPKNLEDLRKRTEIIKAENSQKQAEWIPSIENDIASTQHSIARLLHDFNPKLSLGPTLEVRVPSLSFVVDPSASARTRSLQQDNKALHQILLDLQHEVQKAEREAEEQARQKAERVAREQEEKAKHEAERLKHEQAVQTKCEQETRAELLKQQAAERRVIETTKHEVEEQIRREAEKAKRQQEAQAKREAERAKREAEELAKRQAERLKREQAAQAKREQEAKTQLLKQQEAARKYEQQQAKSLEDAKGKQEQQHAGAAAPASAGGKKQLHGDKKSRLTAEQREDALLEAFAQQQAAKEAAEKPKATRSAASIRQEAEAILRQALSASGEQKKQLLIQALNIKPDLQSAWEPLASLLGPNESVIIDGIPYATQNCFEKVLEINPSNSMLWNNLGVVLGQNPGSIAHIGDTDYTEQDCYVKALEINENNDAALSNLGNILKNPIRISGKEYTQKSCFEKALKLNPLSRCTWYDVGGILEDNDSISVQSKPYTKLGCFVQTLNIDPRYYYAWYELGLLLPIQEKVPSVPYTKRHCYERVIELSPEHAPEHAKAKAQLALLLELEQVDRKFDILGNHHQVLLRNYAEKNKSLEEVSKAVVSAQENPNISGLQQLGAKLLECSGQLEEIRNQIGHSVSEIKNSNNYVISLLRRIEQPSEKREKRIADLLRSNQLIELGFIVM